MTRSTIALRGTLLCAVLWGCNGATTTPPGSDAARDAVDAPTLDAPTLDTPAVDTGVDRPSADTPADRPDVSTVDVASDGGSPCDGGETLCGARCVSTQTDVANCGACGNACSAGQSCELGACVTACESPAVRCVVSGSPVCVNTSTDDANCGACGNACSSGQHCVDGRCGAVCEVGRTSCSGECVDTDTSAMHCGSCGMACPTLARATPTCAAGACVLRCAAGYADCDGVSSNGCEVTLAESAQHCGACGVSCAAVTGGTSVCMDGRCVTSCPTGRTLCDGACVDVTTSASHCGGCGRACPGAANANGSCAASTCGIACSTGYGDCDANAANGCEVNLTNNSSNCGACGTACAPPSAGSSTCVASACQRSCPPGLTMCGSACVDLTTSGTNCGACGNACAVGQVCLGSACRAPCAVGQSFCLGAGCVDLQSDTAHCGSCTNVCPAGQSCRAGGCTICTAVQTMCGAGCANLNTDVANCGACGHACGIGESCTMGTCTGGILGATFQVMSLGATGCGAIDHNALTGDDRGGIALSTTQVFYTADGTSGTTGTTYRFSAADLTAGASVGRGYDGLVTNLRDETVWVLGTSATTPVTGVTSGSTVRLTHLIAIDGATGALGTATIPLSAPIDATYGATGIFSGWDRVVVLAAGNVYNVTLPTGAVTNVGAMALPARSLCDSWAVWGVAEYFGGVLYVDYVASSTAINRARVPTGVITTLATFTNLADMCSFVVSPSRSRWYFHHEGGSQFLASSAETLGYCTAAMTRPLATRYTQVASPLTFVDACAASGRTTILDNTDDRVQGVALPFAVRFFARDLAAGATVGVSSNGYVQMNANLDNYLGGTIVSVDAPNAVIAAHLSDDYTRAPGICIATVGAAPARQWVVEWPDHSYCCVSSTTHNTYEVVISESTGYVDLLYQTMTGARAATTGIENDDGTVGINACPGGGTAQCIPSTTVGIRFSPIP